MAQVVTSWVAAGGAGSVVESYLAEYTLTIGTSGGAATAGSWFVRNLNTLTSVGGANVSLAANVLTLQPGSWTIFVDGS